MFLRSSARSKGIELEIDDAKKEGKKIFVATPTNVSLYRECAHKIIEYEQFTTLCTMLSSYDFS